MGLSVQVGLLASLMETDPEGAEWFKEELAQLNRLLGENGLPLHLEPRSLPPLTSRSPFDGYPYDYLSALRRVAARQLEDPDFAAEPLGLGAVDPTADAIIEQEQELRRSHLLCHSDSEGYYLPIDFDEVLVDEALEIAGDSMVGSSQRLLAELKALAPALGIELEDGELSDDEAESIAEEAQAETGLWIEKSVWLDLYDAARLSIRHGSVLVFA